MTISKLATSVATALLIAANSASAVQVLNTDNNLPCGGEVLVERGDTLAAIANVCGVSAADIVSVNIELADPDRLQAGQRLIIPAAIAVANSATSDLATLLAPFALYPDALLAEILPATTYPLEIVQAERWVRENPNGDPESMNWAPSVTALARYPEVLTALNANLDQTVALGDAFLAEPDAVFDAIQVLREQAQSAGTLANNEYQKVIVEPVIESAEYVEPVIERQTVIRIVPTYAERIYVPRYDPYWAFNYHPNYYSVFNRPLWSFGVGYGFGYGYGFNHYLDWNHYNVRVFPSRYRFNRYQYYSNRYVNNWTYWHHRPVHRQGYRYRAQPRARIVEGQRHLVRVQQRSNRTGANARGNRDYRANERNRALRSSSQQNSSALRQRVTSGNRQATLAPNRSASTNRSTARSANRNQVAGNQRDRRATTTSQTNRNATRAQAGNTQRANRRSTAPTASETRARLAPRASDPSATARANTNNAAGSTRNRDAITRRLGATQNRTTSTRAPRTQSSLNRSTTRTPAATTQSRTRSNVTRTQTTRRAAAPSTRASAPARSTAPRTTQNSQQRRSATPRATQTNQPRRSAAPRQSAPTRQSSAPSSRARAPAQKPAQRSAPQQTSSKRERTRSNRR